MNSNATTTIAGDVAGTNANATTTTTTIASDIAGTNATANNITTAVAPAPAITTTTVRISGVEIWFSTASSITYYDCLDLLTTK